MGRYYGRIDFKSKEPDISHIDDAIRLLQFKNNIDIFVRQIYEKAAKWTKTAIAEGAFRFSLITELELLVFRFS